MGLQGDFRAFLGTRGGKGRGPTECKGASEKDVRALMFSRVPHAPCLSHSDRALCQSQSSAGPPDSHAHVSLGWIWAWLGPSGGFGCPICVWGVNSGPRVSCNLLDGPCMHQTEEIQVEKCLRPVCVHANLTVLHPADEHSANRTRGRAGESGHPARQLRGELSVVDGCPDNSKLKHIGGCATRCPCG